MNIIEPHLWPENEFVACINKSKRSALHSRQPCFEPQSSTSLPELKLDSAGVVLTQFDFVSEILKCGYSKETLEQRFSSCGAVY